MRGADVVIGANYGDEAKGLVTDFLAHRKGPGCVVVRFNGGAQAAHTVQLADGRRHVFSHVGSGSFAGAATYLSRFFVCNPILFTRELRRLADVNLVPDVFVDPQAAVTTPYDMMINQLVEETRGSLRHGSCGVGFGETVGRMLEPGYSLCMTDLADGPTLVRKLRAIQTEWVPARLRALGIESVSQEWTGRFASEGVFERYLEEVDRFCQSVTVRTVDVLRRYENLVFEGAQGLLLDQERGDFPHVTRSSTGIRNVVTLGREIGLEHLNVHYATRAYLTRHGAGPLDWELAEKPYPAVVDATNVPNPHQGRLRFAWLDADRLAASIATDLGDMPADMGVSHNLAISCLDQVGRHIAYVRNGCLQVAGPAKFIATLQQVTRARRVFVSRGPTRETMKFDTSDSTADHYLRSLEA